MIYCIKIVWPSGERTPLGEDVVRFSTRAKKASEKFKKCDGFFIYETGKIRTGIRDNKVKGNKTIFAYGKISQDQKGKELEKIDICDGKKFQWGVRIKILKTVNPFMGIPKEKIEKLGIKQFQIQGGLQTIGGLVEITKDQFDKLYSELKKCSQKS